LAGSFADLLIGLHRIATGELLDLGPPARVRAPAAAGPAFVSSVRAVEWALGSGHMPKVVASSGLGVL
jgi:hypothetical protein